MMAIQQTDFDTQQSDRQRGDELIASRQGAPGKARRRQAGLTQALGWFSIGLGVAELAAPGAVARLVGVPANRALLRTMGLREITSGVGILMQEKPAAWMWSRVGGDVMDLALLARALRSPDARQGRVAMATAAAAGVTVLDLLCSRQITEQETGGEDKAVQFTKTIIIERSPEDLYGFWRNMENLPQIMRHVREVRVLDDTRSHWVVRTPTGATAEWDAEITEDEPNRRLAWRSLPGAQVDNAGEVRFEPAPGGRGRRHDRSPARLVPRTAGRRGSSCVQTVDGNRRDRDDRRPASGQVE